MPEVVLPAEVEKYLKDQKVDTANLTVNVTGGAVDMKDAVVVFQKP
jgi:hypothetical protein